MNTTKNLFFNLTSRCNLRCAKCWRYSVLGKGQDVDSDVLDSFFENFKNYKGHVILGCGENLISSQLNSYVKWVNDNDIRTTILTTALCFNKFFDRPDFFSQNITWGVTLDGFYQDEVKSIQLGINIKRVKINLREVKERYPQSKFYLNYTHTTLNLESTPELLEFANEIGIRKVYLTHLKLFEGLDDSQTKDLRIDTQSSRYLDIIEQATAYAQKHNIEFDAPLSQRTKNCFGANSPLSPIIDVNGDISFCYGRGNKTIGNILQENGPQCWREHFKKMEKEDSIRQDWCNKCHANITSERGYYLIPS